jgi:hypothetical protein
MTYLGQRLVIQAMLFRKKKVQQVKERITDMNGLVAKKGGYSDNTDT